MTIYKVGQCKHVKINYKNKPHWWKAEIWGVWCNLKKVCGERAVLHTIRCVHTHYSVIGAP